MPSAYHQKKVLITGGLGFIGSSLARRLVNEGADVTCVDNLFTTHGGNLFNVHDIQNKIRIHQKDVRDTDFMNEVIQGQDYLFNLAGQTSHLDSMTDPHTDLEINAKAQLSILEACKNKNPKIRIVFASTRQIYGKPDYLPVDEKHPLRPVDVNGINKLSGEMYHLLYHKVYGIKACALRLTNTYGPGMRVKDARQTFLGIWIKCITNKETFQIYGDGAQLRDFNYVDDVVEALLVAAEHSSTAGNVYNLGSEEVISLKALAELLVDCNGSGECKLIPFPEDRKAIDIGDYYSDHSLFSKLTGWNPKTSLREGLQKTLRYYAANRAHYW